MRFDVVESLCALASVETADKCRETTPQLSPFFLPELLFLQALTNINEECG